MISPMICENELVKSILRVSQDPKAAKPEPDKAKTNLGEVG
jgi:hypothetical protein